ncbi:ABC transporter permease [Porphyromonas somerae]|uniref:ABC transporter permease n=1 Tax=Porphyromonas somerae TaxID=322095 RepID=UPI002A83D46C|nr:ABC transporter permease [Porphyromonas somerae]MDY3884018.1 ABC transporter permease [Porphyromonas somerae]
MKASGAKQFRAFVSKEFIHIFRDPYTLLILLLMPVVELLLFGFALNMEVTNIRTALVALEPDRYTQRLEAKIRSHPDFILYEEHLSVAEAEELLQKDKLDLFIVMPTAFEASIYRKQPTQVQMVVDASDPNAGEIRVSYASALLQSVVVQDIRGGSQLPYSIEVNSRMLYNPMMKSSYNFVPGIMGLVLIVLCTIMTSVSIAREKERGSMELLLVSPVHATTMVLAKAVPYFVVSLINIASILILSYFVLGVPIRGSLLLIILVTMLYVLVALAIGLAISSLVSQQRDAVVVSGFGMMMPTILLTGMLFPLANIPAALRWISYLVPATYYIGATRKVMIQGLSFMGIWQEVLALTLFAVLMLTIAIVSIRPRLK